MPTHDHQCNHSSLGNYREKELLTRQAHPPPSSPPSLKHNSKWRAVLALLPIRSTRLLTQQSASSVPSTSSSSPPPDKDLTDLQCESSHPQLARKRTAGVIPFPVDFASPIPTEAASNLNHLLDTFLKVAYSKDIEGRTQILDALCILCADAPSVSNRCVAAGVVAIILNILTTSTTQMHSGRPPPAVIAEESEKALLLLHLITASSEDGCTAALQQSSSMISILGKKLLRISEACTASAIAVLSTLCNHSDAAHLRKALSETAIPSKLVVVLQVASEDLTKQRAGRLLRIINNN